MKSAPSGQSSYADTQALWRFANNERVKPSDLAVPLMGIARRASQEDCERYALAVHDWSRLSFRTHHSKKDRVQLTHDKDVGYELQSTVLIADRDGAPLCAPVQNLRTAQGLLSTRSDELLPMKPHLDELSDRVAWLQGQGFSRALVHIVDREADSIGHQRQWEEQEVLWLIRAKGGGRVQWGKSKSIKLSEVAKQLSYEAVREVECKGHKAVQWIASTTVEICRPARPMAQDEQGKRLKPVPGKPLKARLVISRVCGPAGELLAEWFLLSNVDEEVEAQTLALWYYWRWRIESYFKLLKEAGQQLESWGQESGAALFKRILIASQACATAWQLMRAEGEFADRTKAFLIRLSGRQMKRKQPVTASALLAGMYALFAMNETLTQYSPEELAAFAQHIRSTMAPRSG
jgi:hypothetical protein